MSIPNGPQDLTRAWFEEVTGWSVDDVRVEQIGIGIGVTGALYRAHLGGDTCPSTVIVKLAALDPQAVGGATALRLYSREVAFYGELVENCPIRVPECFHHEIDETGSSFAIVMEDVGGARMIDQIAGVALADAEQIVDRLADWHAAWWGATDDLVERGVAVAVGSPMYPAMLPGLFAEGWARIRAEAPQALDGLEELEHLFGPSVAPTLAQLDRSPVTLLHGDYRCDNMFFDGDELVVLDFQVLGSGSPMADLAYFVTQSLDAEMASTHERDLFERWKSRLHEHHPGADLDGEWERYRLAAIFCVSYPVVASRGVDFDEPRQRALVETMMGRIARACRELDLIELWR